MELPRSSLGGNGFEVVPGSLNLPSVRPCALVLCDAFFNGTDLQATQSVRIDEMGRKLTAGSLFVVVPLSIRRNPSQLRQLQCIRSTRLVPVRYTHPPVVPYVRLALSSAYQLFRGVDW